MSEKAKKIKNLYIHHLWTLAKVQKALADGLITQEEYYYIAAVLEG